MKVNFWQESPTSRCPVLNFIESQSPLAAARIMRDIEHMEEQGLRLLQIPSKMKQFTGYKKLYELKTSFKGIAYRIIFVVIRGEAWLLEAFKKKSNDTPQRYIDTAIKRKQLLEASD